MAFTNLQKASFDIQTDSHKFPTLTKFKNTASNAFFIHNLIQKHELF
jgi:hypothetical protein